MADDAPAPAPSGAPPIDYNAIIQQIMQGSGPVTGPAAPATPAVNPNLPITSLLGEAFGGGVSPLYPMSEAQQTQAGNAALLNFGIGMLQNASGPVRHSLGQAVASGLLGAQGSLAGVREGQAQMLDVQNKQQQMGLEKIKTILPLLMRQQAAGLPNPLLGSGPSTGGGGNLAATGDPIAALPKADALPAIVQRESGGQNINTRILGPDGKPASTASGYYQMLDGTWQEGAALAGIKNPPARAIDASKADQDAAASALFDKHGYAPWKPVAPTTTAAAPSAPTTPPAPVARPTAAPAAPAGTIQGTPDTGGTQVGGPGALPGVIRPPGPLVPGDVGAIVGGMTKAGASPTTLAPGTATAGPTAPTIAQGGPTTVTPPAQPTPQQPAQGDQPPAPTGPLTIEQYRAMHPSVINPTTYTVTPPGLADAMAEKQTAAQILQQARQYGTPADQTKANNSFIDASNKLATLQQQAQSKSLELQQSAQKNADDLTLQGYNAEMQRQQEARLKAQELAQTAAENEKNRQAETARLTQTGQQAIQLEQAKGSTASETKVMDALNETHETARGAIDQLQLVRSLSASAGDPTFWQGIQQSHPSLVRWLANIGSLSDDQVTQLGYSGAMDAALQKLVTMARAGSGFQRVTNMDLQLLQSQAPTGTDPQQWRDAKVAYLQSYMERQMRYVDAVRTLRADGTPLYQAQTQADKAVGDVVPQMPSFTDQPGNSGADQRHRWAADNVQPGTFFRAPDGKRMLIYQGQ